MNKIYSLHYDTVECSCQQDFIGTLKELNEFIDMLKALNCVNIYHREIIIE